MFSYIRKSHFSKVFAIVLLVSFLAELMQPVQLFALTGGPSQPEMAGFTPVSTDNMVDLFSGDFHYTIPIMTVPGPNGGFPINLNYNSNIGMEHEASWVGLGWNLNPGAINRQVRGIPDDFCGDEIEKTYKRRDNNTFLFSTGGGGEVFGADFGIGISQSKSFVYNTYKGITLCQRFGIAASYVRDGDVKDKRSKILTANLGFNLDSDNGVTTSFSMNGNAKNTKLGFNYGYNSKSGTYTFSTQVSVNMYKENSASFGTSYSSAATLPPIHLPMTSVSSGLSGQAGGSGMYLEGFGNLSCNLVLQRTPQHVVKTQAYGLLYLDQSKKKSLQDFNREKELCVDRHSKNLPLPVMTNDVYLINGELMTGSFRAYRSDLGHFHDNELHTTSFTQDIGVDAGFGNGIQLGANVAVSEGTSYTGDWGNSDYCQSVSFKNKTKYESNPEHSISPSLYEPFYFKMSGEQTASDLNHMENIGGSQAVCFPLCRQSSYNIWNGMYNNYTINDMLSECMINRFEQENRTKRASNIEYKTGYTGTNGYAHHIKEFSIINADGERYTYGKALYNHMEKEVQFSIYLQNNQNNADSTTVNTYSPENANGTTRVGKEKLYSCTIIPSYAYSYLITSITSPDYVDINQNGVPDDADFGYWVKFSYTNPYTSSNPYCWRFPYQGANYFMGDRSNRTDDMGSYNYGTKDISYINTIETKTHKAVFYISHRNDALGVGNEYMGGTDTSQRLFKLDSICLFSKEDMSVPIKTAVFEYDYSLCKGVPNNSIPNQGKLTLKKVCFKYALSEKGEQNPYCFRYNGFNPDYAPEKMDRWGNYKGNANYFEHYTTQDSDTANEWASAWLLTDIDLPEGGTITIDYECDDYAYVQDRQAMYMTEVSDLTGFNKENGKYYIYFKKKQGIDVKEYVSGFKHNLMYFKMAVRYDDEMNPDYIQGYIEINPTNATNHSSDIGKVEVKAFSAYDIHPVWFLALQQLKNNRPDLMFNNADANENQSDGRAFFRALVAGGVIDKVTAIYGNDKFYRHCTNDGDYKNLTIGFPKMPSYIRVNVPDKIKYGGGARVKSISISDNWDKSNVSIYRQDYYYRKTENGKIISSGVAEYEPMVCPEENSMRYPVYDKIKGLFFVEDEMYSEEPYGESYFPSANVGYSQVVVKIHTPEQVNISTSGIQRFEFYTAKDFPLSVSQTPLTAMEDLVPNILRIITGGFKQISSSAYSQGYLIELNDMHGKQKSVSTVPYIPLRDECDLIPVVEQSPYTSKIEYEYFSKTVDGIRKIDNQVDVLLGDNHVEKMILGQTFDFVVDQRENHSESTGGGAAAQFMLASYYPPLIGASAMPSFDCFEETVKSVAVTKVIYNTGILKTTRAYNKGSVIITENLQFDPYTGKALLTSVTNEFEQPVYNYSMPAYWYYHNMGSAAENYRAKYYENPILPNGNIAFGQYDVIPYNDSMATINDINVDIADCWLPDNNTDLISLNSKEIIHSRFSNQLNAEASSIVSLVCPTDPSNRRLTVLEDFNAQNKDCFAYHNCNGSYKGYARIYYDQQNRRLYFFTDNEDLKICADPPMGLSDLKHLKHLVFIVNIPGYTGNVTDYQFNKQGHKVYVSLRSTPSTHVTYFTWNDPNGCFPECLDGVLQASATEYKSGWNYDYEDVGIPQLDNERENYLGIPNIYRSLRANLYVTERNQTGSHDQYHTNIAYDGTFSSFAFFPHGQGNEKNMQKPWTWTAEITKYSPFNFEIENRNALNIYSSALYGYKQSLVTAVANNARYEEFGFDSFENDDQIPLGSTRGHILISPQASSVLANYAHSGQKSLRTSNLSLSFGGNTPLKLQTGKEYVFSCWVRKSTCNTLGNLGEDYVFIYNGDSTLVTKEPKVECWQRVEFVFTAKTGYGIIQLKAADGGTFYVDDIRIAPANSTIKSYVYDPQNYRLVAELDENNYATFYNYDEEGILVQVKKETERGIMTIKTTRQNLKKQNSTNL